MNLFSFPGLKHDFAVIEVLIGMLLLLGILNVVAEFKKKRK